MKTIFIYLFVLLNCSVFSQSAKNLNADPKNGKWSLQYDQKVLRVPGSEFRIGISEKKEDGTIANTKRFLKGKVKWNKFRIVVEGGVFENGRIRMFYSDSYLKDKAILVKVFKAKSQELLFSQKIDYHYETKISFLTSGEMGKVPGSIVKYGIRVCYNNGTCKDFLPAKARRRFSIFRVDSSEIVKRIKLERPMDQFNISADGGYFLKRYLVIENDPFKIRYHTAKFMVSLAKNQNISDTLEVLMDYISDYKFDSRFVRNYCLAKNEDNENHENNLITYSSGYYGDNGHNLEVYADVYKDSFFKDSLLLVTVTDLTNCEHYNYLVNTKGGSIKIYSHGLDGSDGSNGSRGSDGSNGSDGSSGSSGSYITKTVTKSDGTTSTVTEQGRGGNGSDGSDGGDGGRGGDGSDGSNGGDGGDIQLYYTQNVLPYLHLIDVRSIPGSGGRGGKGGSGGRGGSGGKGGSGGYGSPSGHSGNDGRRGSDGSSGRDGSDGRNGNLGKVIKTLIK